MTAEPDGRPGDARGLQVRPGDARGLQGRAGPVAAIDCGTNSTRLLVGDRDGTRLRLMRITRLGEGVDASGSLSPSAIDRTVAVLREYQAELERLGVRSVRVTATSAVREADNRDDFVDAARAATGFTPEILSGEEEGRLSFTGAVNELDPADGPFMVADVGGGSTELIVGRDQPEGVVSLDLGCVRLTEKLLHGDPPTPEELSNAVGWVRGELQDAAREMPALMEADRLIGLAGTVTTMAAVEIGLPVYDRDRLHHFVLTRDAAEDVFRTLATERRSQRVKNPGLEEARADVIVGGAVIVVTLMRYFEFDECLVSEADILDGLVLSQLS